MLTALISLVWPLLGAPLRADPPPQARLTKVRQSLVELAEQAESSRILGSTASIGFGVPATLVGVAVIGQSFHVLDGTPSAGKPMIDLGRAFSDSFSKPVAFGLTLTFGLGMTYVGVGAIAGGVSGFYTPWDREKYLGEFDSISSYSAAQVEEKIDIGEGRLRQFADESRSTRRFFGTAGLVGGGLFLFAYAKRSESVGNLALGLLGTIYGGFCWLVPSRAEDVLENYERWKRGESPIAERLKLVPTLASPGPGVLLSYKF